MEILANAGNHFYGIFQAGGKFLTIYIVNFIPWIIIMIALKKLQMYSVKIRLRDGL